MTTAVDDEIDPADHRITSIEHLRRVLPQPNPAGLAKVLNHLDDQGLDFLQAAPFLLLSTASADGRIEVSPKGDEAGFVHVEDERTVLIPDRAGNNLAFGLSNIIENPRVGVIVLRPGCGETLRFSGTAEILADPALLNTLSARGKPALLAIRVHIERAYFHCARSILRAGLWQPESWPEPRKISFGKIMRKPLGVDESVARIIDHNVEQAYMTDFRFVGARRRDGTMGFVALSDRTGPARGDNGSSEALLDHVRAAPGMAATTPNIAGSA